MTLEDNISRFTVEKNREVQEQLMLTTKYLRDEEERVHRFTFTKSIDCRSMMNTFKSECNTLNYKLKRLVCDQDSHQVLYPKRPEQVEVIPNTYMYFKVPSKDQHAPGKVSFYYAPGQTVKNRRSGFSSQYSSAVTSPSAGPKVQK